MKGTYCLIVDLPSASRLRVGALGTVSFPTGVYVYVGSALSGIETRVARHTRRTKKLRWHIDYLLRKATVISTIAVPTGSKDTECAVAKALLRSEGASVVAEGFGSSDCDCPSHLIYFGAGDREWIAESVAREVAMLACVYPSSSARRE